jgi:acyl transferase domain-containing protein
MQAAASHIRQPIAMSALLFAKLDRVLELCKVTAASCGGAVEVANINSSDQVVISGVEACVAAVEAAAKATGAAKKAVRLNVSAPFHCSLLQPAAEVLSRALASINFATPVVPVLSNVTAEAVTDASMFATLLTQQVCAPVDWLGCMQSPSASACDSFLEVGPGVVLSGLAARIRPKSTCVAGGSSGDMRSITRCCCWCCSGSCTATTSWASRNEPQRCASTQFFDSNNFENVISQRSLFFRLLSREHGVATVSCRIAQRGLSASQRDAT